MTQPSLVCQCELMLVWSGLVRCSKAFYLHAAISVKINLRGSSYVLIFSFQVEQCQPVDQTNDWFICTSIMTPAAATGDPAQNSVDRLIDRSLILFLNQLRLPSATDFCNINFQSATHWPNSPPFLFKLSLQYFSECHLVLRLQNLACNSNSFTLPLLFCFCKLRSCSS